MILQAVNLLRHVQSLLRLTWLTINKSEDAVQLPVISSINTQMVRGSHLGKPEYHLFFSFVLFYPLRPEYNIHFVRTCKDSV